MNKSPQKQLKKQYNSIEVFCRFRPIPQEENVCTYYEIQDNFTSIKIQASETELRKNGGVSKYIFSKVFKSDVD